MSFPAEWHYLAVTRSVDTWTIYIDGAVSGTIGRSQARESSTAATYQGYFASQTWYLAAALDESRISSVVQSGDWIKATYNSVAAPSSFGLSKSGRSARCTGK
jgi:hypothetical protein